ncbi:MAG: ABC-F family ATP-binding cassette domain-containing protein [Candidatus Brocadiaceae bacterium]|nr:ABC-F family ATP-binding cassette domain-containing protein [Candidatus Brocadiaceae bacterium]
MILEGEETNCVWCNKVIRLHNVSVTFGAATILDNISIHIRRTDRIGLVGPNGAGKSTLFKLICGLADSYTGNLVCAKSVKIGYLPQEGFVFKKKTVFEEASSAFEDILSLQSQIESIHAQLEDSSVIGEERRLLLDHYAHIQHQLEVVDASKIEAETGKVLKGMGFTDSDFEKSIGAFSGGWQMRVALSKLLLQEPNLLLLDEPTNHLDVDSILWLEEYLKGLKGGLVLISHDRTFLDRNVSKIWELDGRKIHEYHGNYSFYETEKENVRELQTARYTNQQKRIKDIERFIERFRAKNTKASQVQSRIRMLEKMEREDLPESSVKQVKFQFPPARQSNLIVLDVEDISHKYNGPLIFQDVCLSIERGEKVALVGQNGSGKSTLLRLIDGIESPYAGTVKMGSNVLFDYFAQENAENLRSHNTVLQEVESIAPFSMMPYVRSILGAFLFSGDDVFKSVDVLSGGEKSRLSLAKILLRPTNFLILDEPTNHIDITTKKILKNALLEYPGSLLIVSHDRDFLDGLVSKVYELKNSKLHVHLGSFRSFLEKKLSDLVMETVKDTVADKESHSSDQVTIGSQKYQYLFKKEQIARKRKLAKEVQSIEEKIAKLEAQKKELDQVLLDPALYSAKERSVEINQQYKIILGELDTSYKKWEEIHMELESVSVSTDKV